MYSDVDCPYCGKGQEINHDDGYGYQEDEYYQQQCGDCEKTFSFTTSISFYYETEKAPCLNGGDHNWKKRFTPYYPDQKQCQVCGEWEMGRYVKDGVWD